VLVGRTTERRRIDSLLASAAGGTGGVLLLEGEAGIGKSALLAYARDEARAMTQLRMTGVESEAELAFSGLTELLHPIMGEIERLPAPQADALLSALAINAEPANPIAVRLAFMTLVTTLARDAPVLVTVDDAHWMDQSSLDAMAFAFRRLRDERVAVIGAARTGHPVDLHVPANRRVAIVGLSDREAHQLLTGRAGLSRAGKEHLVRVAAGNPLALLELPDIIPSGPASPSVQPPPVGTRVRASFQARIDRLPTPSRLALGLVAADGVASLRELLAAFGDLELGADALAPAEDAGLVTIDGDVVELRHPLLRSVAYHALSATERRRVHGALARAIDDPRSLERRTWHRAAAAVGPDEEVARALDEAALAAERRGALPTMAHGFARAASLSEDADAKARRLLDSADAWLVAGHWNLALDQLEQAAVHATDPGLRADVSASTGQLEAYRSGPEKGGQVLLDAADMIEESDPERATRILCYAVNVAVSAADVHRAVELADRAMACAERAGGIHIVAGSMAKIEAGVLAADPTVPTTLEAMAQLAEAFIDSELAHAEHVFSLVVFADVVLEHYDRADRLIEVAVRRAYDTGRLFMLAFALVMRTEMDFRRGRWSAAYQSATDEWDGPLGLPNVGAWLCAMQARIEAGLGLDDEARAHGQTALEAAGATDTHAITAAAASALGFLELGRGRPRAALEHLEWVADTFERGGVAEPGVMWWPGDLIEAHWRLGDVGAARRRLEVLQAQADATGRCWAKAIAARGAGLLATSADEMEAAFTEAMRWHDQLDAPFERARTQLVWGERRRDLGGDADGPLRQALAVFERMEARPWIEVAKGRLAGEPVGEQHVALTRQEREVAAIVGRGHTNREAAEQLFVSPRTIDFHLRNIYKKVGIRSRTELAVWWAGQEASAADPAARPAEQMGSR
jgi:DNA-binding CsgD family transcriptional regulator